MTHISAAAHIAAGAAAIGAGMVNAIAGGGSLISLPVPIAIGVHPATSPPSMSACFVHERTDSTP